jgi:hypothetical protein
MADSFPALAPPTIVTSTAAAAISRFNIQPPIEVGVHQPELSPVIVFETRDLGKGRGLPRQIGALSSL